MTAHGADGDVQALAANTTEECDRLLQMIDTTLDIAEAESGAASLQRADVDLARVVRDACDLFATVAEDKGVSVVTALPERCDVSGDRERLQRAIANLLDNALKYTPSGGHVEVRSGPGPEGGAVLEVIDDGPGIAASHLPRIFERFYRVDKARSREMGGTGLGLSIVKHLAEGMGTTVSVASEVGRGTRFTVTVPGARPR